MRQVPDCVSSWINGVTLPTGLFGALIFSYPAKTSVSPPSSPLGTFRAEERVSPHETSPAGEERGETDVFAGYREKCDVTGSPW